MELEFSWQIFEKNTRISNLMKIRPVGAKLFRADREADLKLIGYPFLQTHLKLYNFGLFSVVSFFSSLSFTLCIIFYPRERRRTTPKHTHTVTSDSAYRFCTFTATVVIMCFLEPYQAAALCNPSCNGVLLVHTLRQ